MRVVLSYCLTVNEDDTLLHEESIASAQRRPQTEVTVISSRGLSRPKLDVRLSNKLARNGQDGVQSVSDEAQKVDGALVMTSPIGHMKLIKLVVPRKGPPSSELD